MFDCIRGRVGGVSLCPCSIFVGSIRVGFKAFSYDRPDFEKRGWKKLNWDDFGMGSGVSVLLSIWIWIGICGTVDWISWVFRASSLVRIMTVALILSSVYNLEYETLFTWFSVIAALDTYLGVCAVCPRVPILGAVTVCGRLSRVRVRTCSIFLQILKCLVICQLFLCTAPIF